MSTASATREGTSLNQPTSTTYESHLAIGIAHPRLIAYYAVASRSSQQVVILDRHDRRYHSPEVETSEQMNHPRSDHILKLPDELLDSICANVRPSAKTLALVCRRFDRVATPHLYLDLTLHVLSDLTRDVYSLQAIAYTKVLHRTLKKNPALWPFCRNLTCYFDYLLEPGSRSYLPNDIFTWLTAVQKLEVGVIRGSDTRLTLARHAIQHMPGLTHLKLHSDVDGIDLPEIVQATLA
ncbi:Uu.00g107960.m01.CDS01 [Anthostomella pinea]|uniref:Uu.00g107960.m01.CDS01 n=1 Tax=Anthostomella pinea TaxID=933095 RepID=A0AAI8YG11_9PEZI|nr:Uu.00g107960.m01.CDS01 [Anthostomella pinea]